MIDDFMHVKVLLPFRVFIDIPKVRRVVFETSDGAYGFLPHRLDCVAALVPGIITYETENNAVHYVAVDEGVLIKAGSEVSVSVRNAIGGIDLGKLRELVEKEFMAQDEKERTTRSAMKKLESGFIYRLEKFHQE
ncbi:MAG: synthase subunit epsilon [Spirosoma sp.]|nr:synthase subunit epsilon [Spirosoma sp.]